ncbi:MAG TPA: ABC transporter permease [Thermomicrobiales bacterium]|nr:ABC transporter permease [Thermomicrobiales bacterium]
MAMPTTAEIAATLGDAQERGLRRKALEGDVIRTLRKRPLALVGLAILVGWILLALLAPVLPLEAQNGQVKIERKLQPPSLDHFFGTDDVGRDVFARVIFAARVSVPAGVFVVLCASIIGCVLGAISGYIGGFVDSVIMRACDGVLAFPSIILAMTIAAIRGEPSLQNAMIAVVLVLWPEYARLMRALVLSIKSNEYVVAAESIGASQPRIMVRHIMPSTDAPIVVKATLDVGAAIVLTAGLSFIGLGAVPPTAEWGSMVSQGSKVGVQYWWYHTFPGLAIVSVVMALNFFGDGLRDALDPKRRMR